MFAAALLTWGASNYNKSGFFNGSDYVYCIQASCTSGDTVASISDIVRHISNHGLTPSGNTTTFKQCGYGAITPEIGYVLGNVYVNVSNWDGTLNNYFAIVISRDKKHFAISDYHNVKVSSNGNGGLSWDGGSIWSEANTTWTEGVVGAPEPTILALLALGVGGLALRRRIV